MKAPNKRLTRLVLFALAGICCLYIDHAANKTDISRLQIAVWTSLLFAYSASELRDSLRRPKQARIALGIALLHLVFIYLIRNQFPLQTSLQILVYLCPEAVALVFLYGRIGQSLDPEGPFGLTHAERRERALRRS